jgi:hypothetical protein
MTAQIDVPVAFYLLISEVLGLNLDRDTTYRTVGEGYGFPHFLQENARTVPRLSHGLPSPINFQFIIDK